jgi:IS5 family transposase
VLVSGLLHQEPKGGGKFYALRRSLVDCISKGTEQVRYEFGTKGIIATAFAGRLHGRHAGAA